MLGLPWYGYDNTCVEGTSPTARICVRGKSGQELGAAGEFFQELPLLYDLRHKDACDPHPTVHGGGRPCACGPQSFDPSIHTVLGLLRRKTSALMFDADSQSPFFNYVAEESNAEESNGTKMVTHQVWFDSPASLRLKYGLARAAGLRGVGSWRSDFVDYGSAEAALCTRELWGAMQRQPRPRPGAGAGAGAGAEPGGRGGSDGNALQCALSAPAL